MGRNNLPHPRAIQLSLPHIIPEALSQQGGAAESWGSGKCQSGLGEVEGVAPAPESPYSICSKSHPDLSRAEPPRAESVGPNVGLWGAWRVGLAGSPRRGTYQVHEAWGEWPSSQSHATQSLTPPESAQASTPWRRQTPQQGVRAAGWVDRESGGWGSCFNPG